MDDMSAMAICGYVVVRGVVECPTLIIIDTYRMHLAFKWLSSICRRFVMPVSLVWLLNSTSSLMTSFVLVLREYYGQLSVLFFEISLVCNVSFCIVFVRFIVYSIVRDALVRIELIIVMRGGGRCYGRSIVY